MKRYLLIYIGDNPDQALAKEYKKGWNFTENNEIKLDVDGYGLIDASKAVRFRN